MNFFLKKPIGILGGTFDPIHKGHLHLAQEVCKRIELEKISFLPCCQSPLKEKAIASAIDRFMMVELAVKDFPYFYADDREVKQGKISYTIDTLQSFRQEYPDTALCFIMSMDAFLQFDLWYKWQDILSLAHLVVADRVNMLSINEKMHQILANNQTLDIKDLQKNLAGRIYLLNINHLPISATLVRKLLKDHNAEAKSMLEPKVWEYINKNKLYFN